MLEGTPKKTPRSERAKRNREKKDRAKTLQGYAKKRLRTDEEIQSGCGNIELRTSSQRGGGGKSAIDPTQPKKKRREDSSCQNQHGSSERSPSYQKNQKILKEKGGDKGRNASESGLSLLMGVDQ